MRAAIEDAMYSCTFTAGRPLQHQKQPLHHRHHYHCCSAGHALRRTRGQDPSHVCPSAKASWDVCVAGEVYDCGSGGK